MQYILSQEEYDSLMSKEEHSRVINALLESLERLTLTLSKMTLLLVRFTRKHITVMVVRSALRFKYLFGN